MNGKVRVLGDFIQLGLFREAAYNGIGNALALGAAGSADAVDVIFVFFRDVKVNHAVHIVYIDASGGYVCGNEHRQLAAAVTLHTFFPYTLLDVSVNTVCVQPRSLKIVAQPLAHMFGVTENNHPLKALGLNQAQRGFLLGKGGDGDGKLFDVWFVFQLRLHGNFHFIPLVHPRDGHDFLRDGGGKKTEILFAFDFVQNFGHVLEKTHVQHPVRFVQYHGLDFVQSEGFPIVVIHQPPRRRYNNLGFTLQCANLSADRRAAVNHDHPDAFIESKQRAQLVANLNGKLSGGREYQPLQILAVGVNMLNHGNAESKGLAGAGGGFCDNVLPLEKGRNRLFLNRGGVTISLAFQRPEHGFR